MAPVLPRATADHRDSGHTSKEAEGCVKCKEEQSPWEQEREGTHSDQHKNRVIAEIRPGLRSVCVRGGGGGCKLVQSLWKAVGPKRTRNCQKNSQVL